MMKIAKGVEWAAHACTLLAVLPRGWTLSAEALAAYHDVPPAYMAKQMQALSKAGLVLSLRGAAGGYCLAKPADEISLWDITAAISGTAPSFRCTEIRQNGPCKAQKADCKKPCGIAASFYQAEEAFRASLKTVTITDMAASAAAASTPEKVMTIGAWVNDNAAQIPADGEMA